MRALITRIAEHTRRRPESPALIWREQIIRYRELGDMMRAAATGIRAHPPGPIGLLATKSPQAVAVVLGAMLNRRPVLIPSPTLPDEVLRTLFARAGCVTVVTEELARPVDAAPLEPTGDPLEPAGDPLEPAGDPPPDEVALSLTTSGSTGTPKIVPLTTGAISGFAQWADDRFGLGPGRVVFNYSPLNFDLTLLDIWATLGAGGCAVLVDADQATNAPELLEMFARHRVHVVQAVPMFYELLTEYAARSGRRLPGTEHVIFTGDVMREDCLRALPGLFPDAAFYNIYGCTETNDSFIHEVDIERGPLSPMPLGRPLPGVNALIIAADGSPASSRGSVLTGPGTGELYVTTPFQSPGYAGPAPDDRFLVLDQAPDDRRYFRSGDLVRRHADGTVTLVGRDDSIVKIRGQRVNPQEVEGVISGHDQVLEAAVVAIADPRAGHRLHATVRRRRGTALNSLRVRRHCAENLPPAAIPSTMRIVDDPLPRTSTGKIDRNTIKSGMKG